ncbi:MAG TPA: enoyl-CoA hydratase/isomerase family protein [Aquabacterium sp.]|uniref:enoyl-CoA hydratase/isomerase family protein n=1 Tax=Aquabacterium sp. TaxID=1872578 RepID=UPI002E359BC6|nr:enoyl-CoA hydratase/isomerase family protein [Aquabacterium sp.]HEX5357481.1 enoyl-CoA hydratase/isomerase family protein [Aquabacterium sp.]
MSRLDIQHEGHVCHVYLNRPELRNAFDAETIAELTHAFSDLATDKALRAIVLGAHGKAFCAGADLNWMRAMADYTWAENHADGGRLAQMLWTIASSPVPVIAKVQGDCYGGGVGLVACCDVVVAAEQVGFCLSEAKLGLSPATISPYVIKALGERAAKRYFVTAERFTAARAQALGLVHEVCAADDLHEATQQVVHSITHNGPAAVRACKQLVQDVAGQPLNETLRDMTARRIADIRASDEGREGLQAFLQKRTPAWLADARPAPIKPGVRDLAEPND